MLNDEFAIEKNPYIKDIEKHYRLDETVCVQNILALGAIPDALITPVQERAADLVKKVRERRLAQSGLDAFMFMYDLSSEEGIALMCLAESLLRIPDKDTVDKLIRDKLAFGNWRSHLGKSPSLFVNAATWALMLTGKIVKAPPQGLRDQQEKSLSNALKRLAGKGGEPIVRQAIGQAMKILGRQFVMGRTMEKALKRSIIQEQLGYRYSYDMLGEAAFTQEDANRYLRAYQNAISSVAIASENRGPINGPGISVKLSALHPRFTMSKRADIMQNLLPILKNLVHQAKEVNIGITIDAEEAHTLMVNLDLIEAIIESGVIKGWDGFGLAVQAYQKRAPFVIDWLIHIAQKHNQPIMIRLVKGAYWDTEIKLAQVNGLSGYPVYTRKVATDLNYIYCAKKLLKSSDLIYPQFATHNALTVASIIELAKEYGVEKYEFQCLHGMGAALYDHIVGNKQEPRPCRIYAPVGTHEELLAYLVRRLLENGANASFVNRIVDEQLPVEEMVILPEQKLKALTSIPHPHIRLPQDLFEPNRKNSQGVDVSDPNDFLPLLEEIGVYGSREYNCTPSAQDNLTALEQVDRFSPISRNMPLGTVSLATKEIVAITLERADKAKHIWREWSANERAECLEKMAALLQSKRSEFLSLLVYEGGKTFDDAIGELREAIDFCYYYAYQAKTVFTPMILPGPTGEDNQLSLHGRGVIACISPWNFPLAIFLGQVTAGLAAGNCVIAKPASQTVFIAQLAIQLLHQAGIPPDVVQLLPGSGSIVGNALVIDERINGILFTGSTETARGINQKLAARSGPIVPFIAETGGQNAMIVDSSALPEQVIQDVITSAFRSAGQRCSALRVLFIQEDVAPKIITMLTGAMAELKIGHPGALSTDVGPVIDEQAQTNLLGHALKMKDKAKLLYEITLPEECKQGTYVAPRVFEIPSLDMLTEEVFGPILHVVRFKSDQLDDVIAQINRTGYGLTLGIHSRIDETIQYIINRVNVGNIYVNRSMIGAVVGVQPFGGEGLSGTGPKAGGPYYLPRLAVERVVSVNTTASGGNASLMALNE